MGRIGGSQAGSEEGSPIAGPVPRTSTVAIARGRSSGGWSWSAGIPGMGASEQYMISAALRPRLADSGMPGMFGFWLDPGVRTRS